MEVTARINMDSPIGRKLVSEIEKHKRVVKIEYPLPESLTEQRTFTIEESYEECCKILSNHYKVDVQK